MEAKGKERLNLKSRAKQGILPLHITQKRSSFFVCFDGTTDHFYDNINNQPF